MRWGFIILACLILILPGCSAKPTLKNVKEFYGPDHPKYIMNVTYDNKKHQISGLMTVEFVNNLDKTLKHIYFNLWPNATFLKKSGIKVDNVQFNGKTAQYKVKKTKLDISGLSFRSGDSGTVKMNFVVAIPEIEDRFGWYGTNVSLGNWFPILAVYDQNGWDLNPYVEHTDSFFSLTSDFDVTLKTDDKEVIATTGQVVGDVIKKDGMATYHYKAQNVRDFAMQMNSAYHVKTGNEGNVKINVYYTDEQAEHSDELLATGHFALKNFNQLYGDYPWPELDIVGVNSVWFAGMEYPQLVMISLPDGAERNYVYRTTEHEIAHQWFYGVVGNNEYKEAWLDEAFAEFVSDDLFYAGHIPFNRVSPPSEDQYYLNSPIPDFIKQNTPAEHRAFDQMIYAYGAETLSDLRKKLGDSKFYKGLQAYFKEEKFKVSTTADFIRIMEKSSGQDLSQFFKDHKINFGE